jgi:hypothetical protein
MRSIPGKIKRVIGGRPVRRFTSSDVPLLHDFETCIGAAGQLTWAFFNKLPLQGALVGGAVGLYAATALGVAELAVGGLSAYVAYSMFAYDEPLMDALQKTIKFQQGDLAMKDVRKPRRKQTKKLGRRHGVLV